jgi:membrane-associated phospholipid phosphatase
MTKEGRGSAQDQGDPPAPDRSQRRSRPASLPWRVLGGALFAALIALGVRGLAHPAKAGDGGLPPPILPEAATQAGSAAELASTPAPPAPGSAAESAEVDELRAMQGHRTEAQAQEAALWQKGAVLRWTEIAIGLISRYGTSPVVASRVLALLSVAQHDALLAAVREQRTHPRAAPAGITPLFAPPSGSTYPSEHAALAAASAAVLSYCYGSKEQGDDLRKRAAEHEESRLWAGVSRRSDVTAGDLLGHAVAEALIARAKADGSDKAGVNWHGTIPEGEDKWKSQEHPAVVPLRPLWSHVHTWLMTSPEQFRPPPPPALDSPEFAAAITELQGISKARTPEQLEIARRWADAPGSPTPAGHWNRAAAKLIAEHPGSELQAARVFALLNMAVMDAGIGCWEAKYHYWYLRPTQADPTLTLPVGLPNFPSYPSGHACFSGAAAEVLGALFPAAKEQMTAMATEASMSRVYGGIHYKFEGQQGLALGREVGRLAAEKARRELSVP